MKYKSAMAYFSFNVLRKITNQIGGAAMFSFLSKDSRLQFYKHRHLLHAKLCLIIIMVTVNSTKAVITINLYSANLLSTYSDLLFSHIILLNKSKSDQPNIGSQGSDT